MFTGTINTYSEDNELFLDNYIQKLFEHFNERQKVWMALDGRKGYIKKFTYCPKCGKKIYWIELGHKIT